MSDKEKKEKLKNKYLQLLDLYNDINGELDNIEGEYLKVNKKILSFLNKRKVNKVLKYINNLD